MMVQIPATFDAARPCIVTAAKGLASGNSTIELATDAMNQLLAAGWQPESNVLHASHYALATFSITMTTPIPTAGSA
jgi:hydroxybutyrate-dimer hydrolase